MKYILVLVLCVRMSRENTSLKNDFFSLYCETHLSDCLGEVWVLTKIVKPVKRLGPMAYNAITGFALLVAICIVAGVATYYKKWRNKKMVSIERMKQILKHLKILKVAIAIEDCETIKAKVIKLEAFALDEKLNEIMLYVKNKEYVSALININLYIDNNQKLEYSNYLVSFVDILGQQDELAHIKNEIFGFANAIENSAQIKSTFAKTYEPIRLLRKIFQNEYYRYISDDKIQKTNPELDFNTLQTSVFSDFVMNYISLRNTDKVLPLQGVYFMIMSTGIIFLKMLAKGIKIRGGIDLGISMEIDQNELYGAGLLNTYNLESKVAKYPRIVIGDNLIKYLEYCKSIKPENEYDQLNQEFAKRCLRVIVADIDGQYIIDYLGESFKKYYGDDLSSTIDKAYEETVKEYNAHIGRNSKLAFRYNNLRGYFEDRLNIKVEK